MVPGYIDNNKLFDESDFEEEEWDDLSDEDEESLEEAYNDDEYYGDE
jgi:hypothetical protein